MLPQVVCKHLLSSKRNYLTMNKQNHVVTKKKTSTEYEHSWKWLIIFKIEIFISNIFPNSNNEAAD
jgi:hypothetical protein